MSQRNKFLDGLSKTKPQPPEAPDDGVEAAVAAVEQPPAPRVAQPAPTREKPSRRNTKHIGGYFDPAVSRQLRQIALEEDSTVQELVGEALDMLFQSRRKGMIARRAG